MELRHLKYFLAVADSLHFTKAARTLNLSQPTLSLQIKELEKELGVPLFDRVGRSVRLTTAGGVFRQHALRAVKEVELGRAEVADLLGLRRGTLRVGVTHSFSTPLIPRAVSGFRRQCPDIGVVIEKTSGRAVEHALVAGTIDVGIAFAPPESADVEYETLFEEEVVLIAPTGHPLAGRDRIDLEELSGLPLVLASREYSTRRLLDDRMREARVPLSVAVEINDIDSLLEMVRLGIGATVLSRRAVMESRDLVLVPITHPEMTRTAALLWLRDCYRSTAAQVFATVIRQVTSTQLTSSQGPAPTPPETHRHERTDAHPPT